MDILVGRHEAGKDVLEYHKPFCINLPNVDYAVIRLSHYAQGEGVATRD